MCRLTATAFAENEASIRALKPRRRSFTPSRCTASRKVETKRLCWYHHCFGDKASKCVKPLCVSFKLKGISVSSAADKCRPSCRLFITDLVTRHNFLVDSGAAVSCYRKKLTNFSAKQELELNAANCSRISTYINIKLELDFGLRRSFTWSFLVTDVLGPIIGDYFLQRFKLLMDIRNRRLLGGLTFLFVKATLRREKSLADACFSLMTDALDFDMLQQNKELTVEPLGFFSRTLSATEKKYSTFDRELLPIYLSVKHFCYMLEGREVIYTDHKPLVFAFTRKHDNITPRQIKYIEHISQFTTYLRYIAGPDNLVSDRFSRI
ncbi:hypothetical protein AVEN_106992-1 [Araneus ventricosus]|uniref:Reverse transcriptase RNase H-like domain-containing protein n=1 Tax=Araneus ventricosus TaxID=182803 RepID=A0A4Y2R8P8_ARAVE|nr:hypothetical protein AVEN_106992-1 [Araneus ventricosus]